MLPLCILLRPLDEANKTGRSKLGVFLSSVYAERVSTHLTTSAESESDSIHRLRRVNKPRKCSQNLLKAKDDSND